MLIITLSILATCLVSSNCSVTHVRWREGTSQCCFNDGPHFQRSGDVETVLFQCITLITFEIIDQTSPNFQGSRRSSSRWYLKNYIKNGWELTSELTSKGIYILKYSSKFHTNLINNFWSTRSNSTEFTGAVAIIPFDGACKTTWKTVENWRLNWRLNK